MTTEQKLYLLSMALELSKQPTGKTLEENYNMLYHLISY